jgi:endonuclease-8
MEGPSLVIATEEFARFVDRPIRRADGSGQLPFATLKKSRLKSARSWGKHLILVFDTFALRIHFLMFGSYRISDPRKNRIPKLRLVYEDDEIFFYSCAIKVIDLDFEGSYDWSVDLMSKKWNPKKAATKLTAHPKSQICDLLMDQEIFAGLGNIMKNEILFNVRLHPEAKIADLEKTEITNVVQEARKYARQFYKWKKANVLKRNWQVFRKPTCPVCQRKVKKRPTGRLERMSHYCSNCQPKP